MSQCNFCEGPAPEHHNYCSNKCMFDEARHNGGKEHSPNGLPLTTIDRNGDMWEHEHADHPDYKFPVAGVYTGDDAKERFRVVDGAGNDVEMSVDWVEERRHETYALIYSDGSAALTMYECCYSLWSLKDGKLLHGPKWHCGFRLADESLEKIRALR